MGGPVDLMSPDEVAVLSVPQQQHYAALLSTLGLKLRQRQFYDLFPETDHFDADGSVLIYARHRYPKHLEFFAAGAGYRERCFLAANRVGKTTCGSFELTCHLTGLYPVWWTGKRFANPVRCWACGRRNETTRDIVQASLLGPVAYEGMKKTLAGTGMVPGNLIGRVTWKRGVEDLIDLVKVRHVSGGWSTLGMKSYEQGRGSFEGTSQHAIWLDEECPVDVYGECLIRLMTTGGILMLTFTPLEGMSQTVLQFQLASDKAQLGTY
ncbi:MAG: terminase family protein [Hyphomicrobiaceae bacterium]